MTRTQAAEEIVTHKDEYLDMLRRYPVEIFHKTPLNNPHFFRVVVDTPVELDKLISQLRADEVTLREALNRSLVWPK